MVYFKKPLLRIISLLKPPTPCLHVNSEAIMGTGVREKETKKKDENKHLHLSTFFTY